MRVGEALLDLLFPPKCPFCQRLLHDPRAPLCPNCQASLPWLTGRAGERRVDFTQGCWSPLAYQAQVREAVQRYKFAPAPAYGLALWPADGPVCQGPGSGGGAGDLGAPVQKAAAQAGL